MKFFKNIALMKKLLRQGWVRAGVPLSSIESLADHSWSVAVLTYMFSTMENQLRGSTTKLQLDVGKAVLIGLLHDLVESEFFDIDKSIEKVVNNEQFVQFQLQVEEGAIQNILEKIPSILKESLKSILNDHHSEEYHIARVSDLIDLLLQAKEYGKKYWIDENQLQGFQSHALEQLKQYEKQFSFLEKNLQELIS